MLSARGHHHPFPIQALTIPDALAGRDICGKAKTGSGKTLAFGLPLLERVGKARPGSPRALILVPTRELATQVCAALRLLGKSRDRSVIAVYGGVALDPQIAALPKGVDVVVGTPGRLIDLIERRELSVAAVEVLVVDEADRMADMGFMPQVQKILYRIESDHQTMLFSATLDGAVKRLVDRYMHDVTSYEVEETEPTVEQMDHLFFLVHQMDKVKVAAAIASGVNRTLIFMRTKRGADRLVTQLEREGVKAGAIHGDLRQGAREKALADFTNGKVKVLVATDVAAAGSTSTASTSWCTTTPPRTTRRTSTAPGAPPRGGERCGRHADAVEPGERHPDGAAPARPRDPGRRGLLQRPASLRSRGVGRRSSGRLTPFIVLASLHQAFPG